MHRIFSSIIFMLFVISHCGGNSQKATDKSANIRAIPVKIAQVEKRQIVETVKLTGEIIPLYQVDIFPRANGIVVSEKVSPGSQVSRDQVLAEIRQDVPGMEFSLSPIRATSDGVITADGIEIGATVSVQRPAYTISQMGQVYMEGKLVESLIGSVRRGATIDVTTDAYADRVFNGRIAEISPVVDRLSRTSTVKILINNSHQLLKPGMFARARLNIGAHDGLTVPLDAIVRTGASSLLFRVTEGKAERIYVETGVMFDEFIEILGPFQSGDSVVVLGQNLLQEGSLVRTDK